ncbi:hypothetical protein JCM12296A_00440 [Desulfosarcina cetonica]
MEGGEPYVLIIEFLIEAVGAGTQGMIPVGCHRYMTGQDHRLMNKIKEPGVIVRQHDFESVLGNGVDCEDRSFGVSKKTFNLSVDGKDDIPGCDRHAIMELGVASQVNTQGSVFTVVMPAPGKVRFQSTFWINPR